MEAGANHAKIVLEALLEFQQDASFCDTVFVLQDGSRVYAHSAILAAVCPALSSVLNQRPDRHGQANVVDMCYYSVTVVHALIRYVYTGVIKNDKESVDVRNLLALLGVAEYLIKEPSNCTDCDLQDSAASKQSMFCELEEQNISCRKEVMTLEQNINQEPSRYIINKEPSNFSFTPCSTILSDGIFSMAVKDEYSRSDWQSFLKSVYCGAQEKNFTDILVKNSSEMEQYLDQNLHHCPSQQIISNQRQPRCTRLKHEAGWYRNVVKNSSNSIPSNKKFRKCKKIENKPKQKHNSKSNENCADILKLFTDSKTSNSIQEVIESMDSTIELKSHIASKESEKVKTEDIKEWSCDICSEIFNSEYLYNKHRWIHYRTDSGKFKCKVCGKELCTSSSLRHHIKTHLGTPERKHVCQICERRFVHPHRLRSHMNTHTGERPNMCDVCGQRFANQENLTKHKRRHRGDMRYVCEVCGKRFYLSSAKSTHMRTHTKEKRYQCSECGNRFTHPTTLQLHMRCHTGLRPYTCPHCSKTFRILAHCKQHILNIHVDNARRPYPCQLCKRSFSTRSYLKHHQLTHTTRQHSNCKLDINTRVNTITSTVDLLSEHALGSDNAG